MRAGPKPLMKRTLTLGGAFLSADFFIAMPHQERLEPVWSYRGLSVRFVRRAWR